MRLGIRYQLLLPLVILMFGVVGMSTWTAISAAGAARRRIVKQMDDVEATVQSVAFPRNIHTLNAMKKLSGAEFLLCDAQGQPLRDDDGHAKSTLAELPSELPVPQDDGEGTDLGSRVRIDGQVYFYRRVPLGQPPAQYVYLFYPEALWQDALWQAVQPAIILGGIGGLAAFVLAAIVAGHLTRRIQQIQRRTRDIAGGDFSPMPLPKRNDELRELAQSINEMAQRLSQLQETVLRTERLRLLGQVSGGLAHQLRNGVTGANLAVQLHARECQDSGDSEALAVALRQLTLVEMHLKRFLDLGKNLDLHCEPCRLSTLLNEATELIWPKCRHAGIDMRYAPPVDDASWNMLGDQGQLSHLLLNLLTNAIEAAGPGGWVEVRLGRHESPAAGPTTPARSILEVIDSGPGIPANIAVKLFEPFVTGKPEGVGLGLAVCRQVAEAHGGHISWSRTANGTCFRVELPLGVSEASRER